MSWNSSITEPIALRNPSVGYSSVAIVCIAIRRGSTLYHISPQNLWPFGGENINIPGLICEYQDCLCPGSLHHQGINNNDIDYRG